MEVPPIGNGILKTACKIAGKIGSGLKVYVFAVAQVIFRRGFHQSPFSGLMIERLLVLFVVFRILNWTKL